MYQLAKDIKEISDFISLNINSTDIAMKREARAMIPVLKEAQRKIQDAYVGVLQRRFPVDGAIYEHAICRVIGENGFKTLRVAKRLECCGVINGNRLYTIR